MYHVYVLKSSKDNKIYIGYTNNIERRLREHSLGQVSSTKSRRPLALIYKEQFDSQKEAIKKEKYYKSGSGKEHLKMTLNNLKI